MFSTLLGPLPPDPDRADSASDERVRSTLGDLQAAGLELLTDGEAVGPAAVPPSPDEVVDRWRRAASLAAARPVKAVVKPCPSRRGPVQADVGIPTWCRMCSSVEVNWYSSR